MPKPRAETWETCPKPQTPMQRGNFIDLCTDWLVREPHEQTCASISPRTLAATRTDATLPRAVSYLRSELHVHQDRPCAFCTRLDARAVVSNPFAQRHLTLVCDACRALPV